MSDLIIVEDEAAVALAVAELLENAGYGVVGIATTAEEALALAETTNPRVAIVDVKLADAIDGITLAQELANRYRLGIVFVTGDPISVLRRAREVTNEILSKPYSEGELLMAVASACAAANGRSP